MQGGKGNGIMDQAGWDREQDHGSGGGGTGNGIMDQAGLDDAKGTTRKSSSIPKAKSELGIAGK